MSLITHPSYPKYGQNKSPLRVKIDHRISHAPSPRSHHASLVWLKLFRDKHLKILENHFSLNSFLANLNFKTVETVFFYGYR